MIEKNHIVQNNPNFRFAFKKPEEGSDWKEMNDSRIHTSGSSGGLRTRIVQLIDSAQEHICVCSFLIADNVIEDALLSAVERGVRVYLLTSAEVKLKTSEGEDWGRDDEIRELHKKMLARMAGKVYLRSSGHFHAKYVLIDSNRGVMTTCNLTTKALMENPELAVSLDATETEQVWKLFRYQFWEGSEKEMLQKGTLDGVESENKFSEPVPDEGVRCSNISGRRSSILDECLALIESATESIDVTSYGWGNKEITSALMSRVKEGVRVSVIGRNHRGGKQTDYLQAFKEASCDVYGLPLIHAKSILIDANSPNSKALVMSANIDEVSMGGSHELGICLNANDSNKLAPIIDGWKAAALDLVLKSGHGEVDGHLSIFTEGDGWKDIIIENHTVTDYGSLLARSAELVEQTKPQFQSKADVVSRVHEHRWTVEVPRLESGAKAEEWFTDPVHEDGELKSEGVPHEFPVFTLKNNTRVIAIDSIDDAVEAAKYKAKAKAKQIVLR